jgi:hypothetical protein
MGNCADTSRASVVGAADLTFAKSRTEPSVSPAATWKMVSYMCLNLLESTNFHE